MRENGNLYATPIFDKIDLVLDYELRYGLTTI